MEEQVMKRLFSLSLLTILVAAAAIAGTRQTGASVAGSWDITIESPQGKRTGLLVIKQEGDKLTAMMKSPRGERPFDSVTVKDGMITLVMTAQVQGQDMVMTYKGKVDKGTMGGDADFGGFATGTWSAVPHKEEAAATSPAPTTGPAPAASASDMTGVWEFSVELDSGGTGSPTFTLKQEGEKITGTYKGALGEAPVTGTVKGTDVTLSYKITAQGQEIVGTYAGKLTGSDSMTGTVTFSLADLGKGKWTAKKKK
jgi:cytochrome c556